MKIFRIFGLLFLASCGEVTIPDFSPCQLVTFSDALPVQFWLSDCDTYNETVPKGVHEACFCHPWQCDDQIRIQFQDDNSPENTYYLGVKNSDGNHIASLIFSEVEDGIHSVYFSPETEGICDEMISLHIYDSLTIGDEVLTNPGFDEGGVLSPWESVTGSGLDWTQAGGTSVPGARAQATFSSGSGETDPLRQDFTEQPAGFYRLLLRLGASQLSNVTVLVTVYSGTDAVSVIHNTNYVNLMDATEYEYDVTITGAFDRIEVVASKDGPNSFDYYVSTVSLKTMEFGNELAKSDCLQIATTQDETELIEYSNGRNFAGLIYSDISPDASFNIRVPCRFFHEEFPEEDEAIELTSQVVTTSSQMKSQKLLEVKHVPYYFHKKLQLILKHHTLEIGGVAYKKEERYEINKGNMKWPLKSATCLLTEKSSVLRNTL